MSVIAIRAQDSPEPRALAGVRQLEFALRLTTWMEKSKYAREFSLVSSMEQLSEMAKLFAPRVIFIEDEVLEGARLDEAVGSLPAASHIVFLAGNKWLDEAASHVARGAMDFVQKSGEYFGLVTALIERSLQGWPHPGRLPLSSGIESNEELSAIFRHEINNPLTGILGNAELLLAHRHQIPPSETQRLQTIVGLAVRLRETIRRLSNEWEAGVHTTHVL